MSARTAVHARGMPMSTALTLRLLAASSTAAGALITATPALAQQMGYEQQVYEYAQPAPPMPPQPTYIRQPVVQATPPQPAYTSYQTGYEAYQGEPEEYEYEVEYAQPAYPQPTYSQPAYPQPAYQQPVYQQPQHHQTAYHPPVYPQQPAYPQPAYPQQPVAQPGYPPMPPVIDRDAWIDDCRAYLRDRRRRADTGAVVGGVLGAAGGAVAGNAIAKAGDKLGGALIGGGVGGLVGLFIGQAIALAGGDGTKKDCKRWLRTYEDSYANNGYWNGYGQVWQPGAWQQRGYWNGGWQGSNWTSANWYNSNWGGYNYHYGYTGYVVVPQTTVVTYTTPMVPVVREVIVEEWVETEVVKQPQERRYYKPAPKVRYIKQQPVKQVKQIKYIKGK